jgi:hypothetical protein
MQDSKSVIVQAADGFVKKLAGDYDVSLSRMYEILGNDNPYPKTWKLLRSLGKHNPDGLRQVQADFNGRCDLILGPQQTTSLASLHKELTDVIQAELNNATTDERRREVREAIAKLQSRLSELDKEANQ